MEFGLNHVIPTPCSRKAKISVFYLPHKFEPTFLKELKPRVVVFKMA